MAFTSAQLAALEEAIALGALSVRYADRTVTYRNQEEMLQLLGRMQRALSGTVRPSVHTTQFRRGE